MDVSRRWTALTLVSVAAVAATAVATAAPPKRSSAGAKCTAAAAKKAILASPALRVLQPTLASGGGVDRLICHDLTRDGVGDMAATVFSGGTAGDIAWVAFRRSHGKWLLMMRQLQLYKVSLFLAGGDLADSEPVYRTNDPNCCPSGGFDHRRFHWNGKQLVVVRRWHDKHLHP